MKNRLRGKKIISFLVFTLFLITNAWTLSTSSGKIDLKTIEVWPWSNTSTYNKSNCTFKTTERWKGFSIPFEYNASDYNYLEIKYKQKQGSFVFTVEYSDKSTNMTGCVEYKNVAYIPLDPEKKAKIISLSLMSFTTNSSLTIESLTFVKDKPEIAPVVDKKEGNFNSSISSIEIAKQMKAGVNLINTLDAFPHWIENKKHREIGLASEICWESGYTTKEIIDYPKSQGFECIRITVTWYNHIIDDKYTIDPEWMARVKQVVDWAMDAGYYVILNEHHSVHDNMNKPLQYADGYIARNNPEDIAESKRFLKAIWTQIAAAFNGSYDEHLIFETLNEPRNTDATEEHILYPDRIYTYCAECKADIKLVNEYNQLCLDTIRASGGNNANRFVMIPGIFTYTGSALISDFKLPKDKVKDKLMVTVHDYAVKEHLNEALADYDGQNGKAFLEKTYADLNKKFVKKNIPVVIGETSLDSPLSSLEHRLEWIEFYSKTASKYGMPLLYCSNLIDKNNIVYNSEFARTMIDNWQCK